MTEMIIHFICRGNSFRSVIAEACLNSLRLTGLTATSSGTTAAAHRTRNLPVYTRTRRLLAEHGIEEFAKVSYGDQLTQSRLDMAGLVVCMNQRVHDECQPLVTLPASTRVWSVADIGEPGRIARTETERALYRREAYQEIAAAIGQLVSEISL